jgi:retron-type reverse transcriptase
MANASESAINIVSTNKHKLLFRLNKKVSGEQCFSCIARDERAQWVLEADIKACFDAISHEWLIDNIPVDKTILQKWLKAGFVYQKRLFPTESGTPQGGIKRFIGNNSVV